MINRAIEKSRTNMLSVELSRRAYFNKAIGKGTCTHTHTHTTRLTKL